MSVSKALVSNSENFSWSDGSLFNGYVLLVLALPMSTSGTPWSYPVLNDNVQRLRVPTSVKIPIREGVIEPGSYIWRTDSLTPPATKYAAFYYDSTDRLIAIDSSLFSVVADKDLTHALFSAPTAATALPLPRSTNPPIVEIPTGTIDGANTTFTISTADFTELLLYRNFTLLVEGVDYTESSGTLTLTFAPAVTDQLVAFIF